jgi:hypothetical protein
MIINKKNIREKKKIQKMVTINFLALADFVVKQSGPIKSYKMFCQLTDLNESNLTYIRSGSRMVPLECAIRACDVFDVSYDWMIADRGDMFNTKAKTKIAEDLKGRMEKIEKLLGVKVKSSR